MRALTFHGPRDVRVENVPEPVIEQPTDCLVRVTLSAICGSDLHVYRGQEKGLDAGTILGHEFIGEVVAAGSQVRRHATGDRVVSPFTTSCAECFYCRTGLTARCERGQLFGWVEGERGLHGAQAELVRVPLADSTLVGVPADTPTEGALFAGDILATGMFCAELAQIRPGAVVAVIGCGPVGLMAAIAARERGADRVLALDLVPERLALAASYGAEPVLADDQPLAAIHAATDGRGADAVLEVVGSPQASRLAFSLVRPGGVIAAVGVHTEPQFPFSPGEAYDKNLTYRAGRCPARRFTEHALDLVAAGDYDLSRLVSDRLSMEAAPDAYDRFDRRVDGCTKVVLSP